MCVVQGALAKSFHKSFHNQKFPFEKVSISKVSTPDIQERTPVILPDDPLTEAEIDAKSRMVTAVVRVENADNPDQPDLPIGLFVNAEIKGRWVDNIVTLPRAALRNQNQVLIVDENNRIQFRPVSILRFENDDVLVSSGLQSGDIVNISPLQTVIEGMRVNPVVDALNRG